MTPRVALFDLDGTLSDSAPGILASMRHAFDVVGLPPLDDRTARSLLGPPFYVSLPPLVGAAAVPAVLEAYRARYAEGAMFDTTLYPGIPQLLAAARAAGVRMAVATSKPEHFAVPIVEQLAIAEYFETIGGDDLAGSRPSKAHVLTRVLEQLGAPIAATVRMVGDRDFDVLGAREHGIDCAGAAWGYGSVEELRHAGADPICATPGDLARAWHLPAPGPQ